MKYTILSILSIFLLLFNSCDEDDSNPEKANLILNFSAMYQAEPLVLFSDDYDYNGNPIQFNTLQFYLSNIELKRENGESVLLKDIIWLDFSPSHLNKEEAVAGMEVNLGQVDTGKYSGISFSVGVEPVLNQTNPADYSSEHPLAITSNFWEAWDSYIFMKLEGRMDTTQDGLLNLGFLYHTGTDDLYRSMQWEGEIVLLENDNSLKWEIHVDKMLDGNAGVVQLINNPIVHTNPVNPESVEISTVFVDNLSGSFEFQGIR